MTVQRYKDEFIGTYLAGFGLEEDNLWFAFVILAHKMFLCLACVYLQ